MAIIYGRSDQKIRPKALIGRIFLACCVNGRIISSHHACVPSESEHVDDFPRSWLGLKCPPSGSSVGRTICTKFCGPSKNGHDSGLWLMEMKCACEWVKVEAVQIWTVLGGLDAGTATENHLKTGDCGQIVVR